jgi:hypothetical protein
VGEGWRLTLAEQDRRLSASIGSDDWRVTDAPEADGSDGVPVAISGGWDGGRLTVEVLFLETPPRLTVSCERAEKTFTATWGTVPLRAGTLHDLRRPE